jgi:hypothetical protein
VDEITGAELDEIEIDRLEDGGVQLDLVVRSPSPISHSTAVELQEFLALELDKEVRLILTVIDTEQLEISSPPSDSP